MWIEERTGKYRYFERYKDSLTGKTKRVSVTLDKDNDKCRRKAAVMLQRKIETALGVSDTPQDLTLQELIDKYTDYQRKTVKESTATRNEYEAKAVARILGGSSVVNRLTTAFVTDRLLSAGESPTSTNARMKYLRALIRWGYKSDLIPSAALADKLEYLPDYRKKEKLEVKYMEVNELESVLNAMKVKRWKLLTQFLCLSGLRIGELVALDDADVTDKYIHINKTYSYLSGKPSDTPKTDTSNRDVYIQSELAECIAGIRAERKKWLLKSGKRSELFFPDLDGGYLHYDAYRKYLKETTAAVIGRPLTPHACRHTMTSIFAAQGAEFEVISRRLGHSGSDITKEIYYHVTELQRKKDEGQIDKIKVLSG